MALSLYRKYRPEVFEDVVGQEHVEKTLMNAVAEGTVAHAYLFCGPRGTGKTTTARLLAKALLCEQGPTIKPDGSCVQCQEIAQGTHPDVNELDAASRTGVDNVREEIIGRVNFAPTHGRYKIYIIDEVHMLSNAAFNALLKTLEEPPEHVIFVLCTTDPHKVPETIQSRCQRFDFRRFSVEEIVGYLERVCAGEGYQYEPEALEFIAVKSAGGMRDATTALEQVGVFTGGNITFSATRGMFGQIDVNALFEISSFIARRDTASCFVWIDQLVGKGTDLTQFARNLTSHMRDLYVTALTGGGDGIVACTASQLEQYRQQAAEFGGAERLSRAMSVCGALVNELRNSPDARLSVELAMTRLCRPEGDLTLESLAERIEALERGAVIPTNVVPVREAVPSQQPTSVEQEPAKPAQSMVADAVEQHEAQPNVQEPAETQVAHTSAARSQGSMSVERLLAAVLTIVKREDVATGALLNGISLEEDAGKYHLLFPSSAEFAMKLASTGDARELIGRAFEEALGSPVSFECRIGSFAGIKTNEAFEASGASDMSVADDGYYDSLAASEPVDYDQDSNISFGDRANEPNFDEPIQNRNTQSIDDETAANIADALSAFGKGVKVQEIDNHQ